MPNGFVHSVKVPRLYKVSANILRRVREDGASFKTLIYEKKHPNVSGIYALTLNALQRGDTLNQLIRKTGILLNEPRLDPWLARILITELIWGKKRLTGGSKPVETVLAYEKKLQDEFTLIDTVETPLSCEKQVRKPRYVRVNTLLLSVDKAIEYFQNEGWSLLPPCANYEFYLKCIQILPESSFIQDYHISELFVFPPNTSFFKHQLYKNGEILLQDKASCLSSYLLDPTPGSTILDMCAAPGMKTTHLAAMLQNQGKIYAVEIDNRRFETLNQQVEITNSYCVQTLNKDALTLEGKDFLDVDYILVDPTCSGSGIIDRPKRDAEDGKYAPERLNNLRGFQVFLLRHALLNFPSVKKVVYSTCSLNIEENENVIDEILTDVGDAYSLASIEELLSDNWMNYSSKTSHCKEKCLYARPEVDLCNGFFVAIFERNFDVPLPAYSQRGSCIKKNKDDRINQETGNSTVNKSKRKKKRLMQVTTEKIDHADQSIDQEKDEISLPRSDELIEPTCKRKFKDDNSEKNKKVKLKKSEIDEVIQKC